MGSCPTGKCEVLSVALPRRRGTVPRMVVPSRKVTGPVGVPLIRLRFLTEAVRETGRPDLEDRGLRVKAVAVPSTGVGVGVGVGSGVGVGVGVGVGGGVGVGVGVGVVAPGLV